MKYLLIVLLLLPTLAAAQGELTFTWDAPTYGTPVKYYVVEVKTNDLDWSYVGDTTEAQYKITVEPGALIQMRVAGVDSLRRQGLWSEPSDPWVDAGGPGIPGKPDPVEYVILGIVTLVGVLSMLFRKKEKPVRG